MGAWRVVCLAGVVGLAPLPAAMAQGKPAPGKKPAAKAPTAKPPVAKPAGQPAGGPKAPEPLTLESVAVKLRALGYAPVQKDGAYRIKIEDESYGYQIAVRLTDSKAWLICTAELAPIPDLTKVPSAPLLSLLGTNDQLVGMYFSYNRESAQIVLNAAIPVRAFTLEALKGVMDSVRIIVKKTEGLWDPARW